MLSFRGQEHNPVPSGASTNWKKANSVLCPSESLEVHIKNKDNASKFPFPRQHGKLDVHNKALK